jgi:hypothetical protein
MVTWTNLLSCAFNSLREKFFLSLRRLSVFGWSFSLLDCDFKTLCEAGLFFFMNTLGILGGV